VGTAPSVQLVDFTTTYRFTPRIADFVRHIHDRLPNIVDIGHDWHFTSKSELADKSDHYPQIEFVTEGEAIERSFQQALHQSRQIGSEKDRRVALVCLGNSGLQIARRKITETWGKKGHFELVESRDDYFQLNYARRAIVVTSSAYSSGLQFSDVVVACTEEDIAEFGVSSMSAKKALMTYLYLAITRAETNLHIITSVDDDTLNTILQNALDAGLAHEAAK
jgi:hypothetical protein